MAQNYTCPRGHRWEGEVKGSVANPRTRVICPTCGLLALTPVRANEPPPPAQASKLDDTLMEPLHKILERAKAAKPESTVPDLDTSGLAPLPPGPTPVKPGAPGARKETPEQ